jgi:hypothetical protein
MIKAEDDWSDVNLTAHRHESFCWPWEKGKIGQFPYETWSLIFQTIEEDYCDN